MGEKCGGMDCSLGLLSGGVGSSEDFVSEKRSSEMFWTAFIDKALQAEVA